MRRLRGGEKGGECDLVHPCHGLVMGVPTDGMKIEKDSFFWDRKNLGLSAIRNSLQFRSFVAKIPINRESSKILHSKKDPTTTHTHHSAPTNDLLSDTHSLTSSQRDTLFPCTSVLH